MALIRRNAPDFVAIRLMRILAGACLSVHGCLLAKEDGLLNDLREYLIDNERSAAQKNRNSKHRKAISVQIIRE